MCCTSRLICSTEVHWTTSAGREFHILMASVKKVFCGWNIFSREKWYQDQQFWLSSFYSRARYVRQCRVPKSSLLSQNLTWKKDTSACHNNIVNDKLINSLCQWAFFTPALMHHKGSNFNTTTNSSDAIDRDCKELNCSRVFIITLQQGWRVFA